MIAFGRVMLVSVFRREKESQYCKAIALGADLPMSNVHDPELKLREGQLTSKFKPTSLKLQVISFAAKL